MFAVPQDRRCQECRPAALLRRPLDRWLLARLRTISQEEIDQRLVGDAIVVCQALEVVDDLRFQSNGDLLLDSLGVWVLSCI